MKVLKLLVFLQKFHGILQHAKVSVAKKKVQKVVSSVKENINLKIFLHMVIHTWFCRPKRVVIILQRKKLHSQEKFKFRCSITFFKNSKVFLKSYCPEHFNTFWQYKTNIRFCFHTALWYFKKVLWRLLWTS